MVTGARGISLQAYSARSGAPLTYVDGLEVWIGKDINTVNKDKTAVNHTASILRQLVDVQSNDWDGIKKLGDGSANHPLVVTGTGPIKLDFLPNVYFTDGEYYIELVAPAKTDSQGNRVPNGGRIFYNLYVE